MHSHSHSHAEPNHTSAPTGSAASRQTRRLAVVLVLTTVYMVAEVIGGLLTNSLALLADAGHMLTDAMGVGMALAAIWFAQRPATPSKTYGFYRAEILAAVTNALVLFGIAGFILYEAWRRFQAPPEIDSGPMLAVAFGGLIVNLIGFWLLFKGAGESLNVQGAFLEVLSDLLGTVGVMIAALVIGLTGWWQADPIVSVIIGLFILPRTWILLKSGLDVLLEATPSHVNVAELEAKLRAVPGVAALHDLHIWTITSGFVAMSGHVQAAGRPSEDVLHDVQAVLREDFRVEHSTLQVEQCEPGGDGGSACCQVDPRCLVVGERAMRSVVAGS